MSTHIIQQITICKNFPLPNTLHIYLLPFRLRWVGPEPEGQAWAGLFII
jgi:hypothetical protein